MRVRGTRLWCLAGTGLAVAVACGGGTPPERVDQPLGLSASDAKPSKKTAAEVELPPGVVYGFDAGCEKCRRTRGDGCVFKAGGKPVGCGAVHPQGKHAVVAWATRKAKRTLWWFGPDGKTKAFWSPCSSHAEPDRCRTSVRFIADLPAAVVEFGVEGADPSRNAVYELEGPAAIELDARGPAAGVPSPDGARLLAHESVVADGGAARVQCVDLPSHVAATPSGIEPWAAGVKAGDAVSATWVDPSRAELVATRDGAEQLRVAVTCP